MKIEFDLDPRIQGHFEKGQARAVQFDDGTIVIAPPGPYTTTVASAAFSTLIQRIASNPIKVTA